MAVFFANAAGAFLAFCRNVQEQATFFGAGGSPAGTTFTVSFDENTNAALVTDIEANSSHYTAPAGVLKKDGATVSINAAGPLFAIASALAAGFTESQIEANIAALWAGTATTQQAQMSIAALLYVLHVKLALI